MTFADVRVSLRRVRRTMTAARLGHLGTAEVVLDWPAIVLPAVLVPLVAVRILTRLQHPGVTGSAVALTAAGSALLGMAVHLAAQLATAWHRRCAVRQVCIWGLGARVELDGVRNPSDEAAVAAAGPAATLLAGLGMVVAGGAVGRGSMSVLLGWSGAVLAAIGLLDLLPAVPFSGGRLLRAGLWAYRGSRSRAAAAASVAGRFVGLAVICAGVGLAFAEPPAGIATAALGVMICSEVLADRRSEVTAGLRGLTAADVMTTPPSTLPSWWTVAEFFDYLGMGRDPNESFVLVDLTGYPGGVVDVRTLTQVRDPRATRVRACRIRTRTLCLGPDTPLADVVDRLDRVGGVAVVTDQGRIVATVASRGLDSRVEAAVTARNRSTPPSNASPSDRVQP